MRRTAAARIVATRVLKIICVITALTGLLACRQPAVSRNELPDGWIETSAAANQEIDAGNAAAAISMFEKIVASRPDFHPAHEGLADAHASMENEPPSTARTHHLEMAATHYRRALDLELAAKPQRPPSVGKLLAAFDRERLNRPSERVAITRELLKHYPADGLTHLQFIDSLLRGGNLDEMDRAIRVAGESLPASDRVNIQNQIGGTLALRVLTDSMEAPTDRTLTPSDARKVLTSAIAALDEGLKTVPDSSDLLQQKSMALGVLARIEPDAQRVDAIRKNAADLQNKADMLRARSK